MAEKKTPTTPKKRKVKAATLLVYIEDYMEQENISNEDEVSTLVGRLRDTIVDEAKAKARS